MLRVLSVSSRKTRLLLPLLLRKTALKLPRVRPHCSLAWEMRHLCQCHTRVSRPVRCCSTTQRWMVRLVCRLRLHHQLLTCLHLLTWRSGSDPWASKRPALDTSACSWPAACSPALHSKWRAPCCRRAAKASSSHRRLRPALLLQQGTCCWMLWQLRMLERRAPLQGCCGSPGLAVTCSTPCCQCRCRHLVCRLPTPVRHLLPPLPSCRRDTHPSSCRGRSLLDARPSCVQSSVLRKAAPLQHRPASLNASRARAVVHAREVVCSGGRWRVALRKGER